MSWPVTNTLMVEPTESEPLAELDRFVDAMLSIRQEIKDIEAGKHSAEQSPLRNAPHTSLCVTTPEWDKVYSRQQAVFPTAWTREQKYWPPVRRVNETYGERNFACSCMAWQPVTEDTK